MFYPLRTRYPAACNRFTLVFVSGIFENLMYYSNYFRHLLAKYLFLSGIFKE